MPLSVNIGASVGLLGHPAAGVERDDEQHDADRARLEHAARADPAQVDAHQQRDRNREADRHRAPRARLAARSRRRAPSTAMSTIMMPSTATSAVHAGDRTDLLLRHLAERLAVAPHRGAEDHEVLHRAAEHDADDDPDARRADSRTARRASGRRAGPGRRSPRSGGRRRSSDSSARSRGRRRAARPASRRFASSAKTFAAMSLL